MLERQLMFEKVKISRLTLINIILAALLLGAFFSPLIYSGLRRQIMDESGSAGPLSDSDQRPALALQQSYMNVFRKAAPSVVYIRTNALVRQGFWLQYYQQVEGAGSGFIIDKEGYIVTNNHVVAGAQKIEVIFQDNTKARATIVGRDESSDVAVIKVPPSDRMTPAILGDSDKVEPGQLAFALGSPFGLESTFTVGIISAKQRHIDNSRYSRIQTDASINPGNSGGPLLNVFGEVVGINQSIIAPNGQGGSVGIGFAIPINEAKAVIDQLKREERIIGRPALGVQVGTPTDAFRSEQKLGNKTGLVVMFVVPGSAAQDAGIQEYDFIVSVNNKEVKQPDDLIKEVQAAGIGGRLQLKIMREGREMNVAVTVGEDVGGQQ